MRRIGVEFGWCEIGVFGQTEDLGFEWRRRWKGKVRERRRWRKGK